MAPMETFTSATHPSAITVGRCEMRESYATASTRTSFRKGKGSFRCIKPLADPNLVRPIPTTLSWIKSAAPAEKFG